MVTAYEVSRARACEVVHLQPSSYYDKAIPDPEELALRHRLRDLATVRVRSGYRRLTVMLRQEGWLVNAKRVFRIYREEGLGLRRKFAKKRVSVVRGPYVKPEKMNQLWAMDFVADRLEDGGSFRILTLIDAYTREALCVWPDHGMNAAKVVAQLEAIARRRALPEAIRVDNGSEFYSREMDAWAYRRNVRLDFIRPGKPTENGHIESFNGRLRDECLNVPLFFSVADAQQKLEAWRTDFNHLRPHSALASLPPAAFARALCEPPKTNHPSRGN
jgi:putative transposase